MQQYYISPPLWVSELLWNDGTVTQCDSPKYRYELYQKSGAEITAFWPADVASACEAVFLFDSVPVHKCYNITWFCLTPFWVMDKIVYW